MGQLMLINPRKRRTAKKATPAQLRALRKARAARKISRNPAPRRKLRVSRGKARVRRNPIGLPNIMSDIMGAVQGAAGAFAVNAVFNVMPLPLTMKSNPNAMMPTALKLGLAVAVGVLGRPLLGRAAGKMAEGAMTVVAYDAMRGFIPIPFGGTAPTLGYYSPGLNAGSIDNVYGNSSSLDGVGEYISPEFNDMTTVEENDYVY